MKTKFLVPFLALSVVLVAAGCGSSQAPASPEEKKAFMGSQMPADFKQKLQAGQAAAAQKSQAGAQKTP